MPVSYTHLDVYKRQGDEATGWSIGWKVNLWARLLDGNHAFWIINNMLKLLPGDEVKEAYPQGRTYPNLFDAHPPFQDVYKRQNKYYPFCLFALSWKSRNNKSKIVLII